MKTEDIEKMIKTFVEIDKKATIQGKTPIYNISEEEYNRLIAESEEE